MTSPDSAGPRRPAGILRRILGGYGRLFKAVAAWSLGILGAVGASAAIVWPLWRLAMRRRGVYNALVTGLTLAALLTLAFLSLRRSIASGRRPSEIAAKLGKTLLVVLAALAMLVTGYVCAVLFMRGAYLAAVTAGLACLALAGWLFFGRSRA